MLPCCITSPLGRISKRTESEGGWWAFTCQRRSSRGDFPLALLPRKVCGLCVVIS